MRNSSPRIFGIDILRSAAIIMMMAYHLAYDLEVFYGWGIGVFDTGWMLLERITAVIFLLLVGLCFVLSWKRKPEYGKFLIRGLTILSYGFIVSIATFLIDQDSYVRFGILHLIGVSTIIMPLFVPMNRHVWLLGVVLIAIGTIPAVQSDTGNTLLLPFGFPSANFHSVDYFPVFPWLGVILIGMGAGWLYTENPEQYKWIPEMKQGNQFRATIRFISSHSLVLYMLHQPVILVTLWLLLHAQERGT